MTAAKASIFARVAVSSPLRRTFDYLVPEGVAPRALVPGVRVRVPFGRSTRIGAVLEVVSHTAVPADKLKPIAEILDPNAVIDPDLLGFLSWASEYFHYPIGEVVIGTLPALLRQGRAAEPAPLRRWQATSAGMNADLAALAKKAPRQLAVLRALREHRQGLEAQALVEVHAAWRAAMRALEDKGYASSTLHAPCAPAIVSPAQGGQACVELTDAQRRAVETVSAAHDRFAPFLLDGVTGSGKTEVYLQLIERTAALGRQAMVLIPEIGLTPQTVARFRARLPGSISLFHSGLSDAERLEAWQHARSGRASAVVGTRSAIFLPLKDPGLFIVDEEHDPSFKQQDGFRYSARDLAVVRARRAGAPVVLGTATPSLESLANVERGRYRVLSLPARAAGARPPRIDVIDLRNRALDEGLSDDLLRAVGETLDKGEQVLLFLNRRGYAPVLICHRCGWLSECPRCDAHMVYHRADQRLRCHHCMSERACPDACPDCEAGPLRPVGLGTQRVAAALARHFPAVRIDRVDRDSTRRRGVLEGILDSFRERETDVLVGTQMLAKGHHFPSVTLVGIVDADGGLYGADFRASERMAQLLVQVAGRAGRGEREGRVILQTHHPHHPLLRLLIGEDYAHFAKAALEERRVAKFPPYAHLALVRIEATMLAHADVFANDAVQCAAPLAGAGLAVRGPVPAPMERRAGRHRLQVLVESEQRATLHRFLTPWLTRLEALKSARRVRWSLDVDPQELF